MLAGLFRAALSSREEKGKKKPVKSERSSLRSCLMAALLLFTVWQLTVSDPFYATDKILAGYERQRPESSAEMELCRKKRLFPSVFFFEAVIY